MPAPDFIVYGTVCLDVLTKVDSGGRPLTDAVEFPGGEAFNTATALAGWGANVLLTGTATGGDAEGERLRHLLQTHPLGLSGNFTANISHNPNAITPVCWVNIAADGDRTMTGRGFKEAVAPSPLPESLFVHRPLFISDPNLGASAVMETLRAASFGCPIIAMDLSHVPEIVAKSRVVIESQERLRHLQLTDAPADLAKHWVAQGAQTAIVTLGAEGCVVADTNEGVFIVPAFAVPDIMDTTGAGDTFRAGLCFGLHTGLPLRNAVRFACAAAALHCQVLGGGSRVPLTAVQKLYENHTIG